MHALCDRMQKVASFIILSIEVIASLRQGSCDQGAISSLLDELKNFAANIFLKLVYESRTGSRALNGEIAATIQVQLY